MKKRTALLLSLVLVFSLAACGRTNRTNDSSAPTTSELAGTGDWQAGQRFSSGASAAEVQDWVSDQGL